MAMAWAVVGDHPRSGNDSGNATWRATRPRECHAAVESRFFSPNVGQSFP